MRNYAAVLLAAAATTDTAHAWTTSTINSRNRISRRSRKQSASRTYTPTIRYDNLPRLRKRLLQCTKSSAADKVVSTVQVFDDSTLSSATLDLAQCLYADIERVLQSRKQQQQYSMTKILTDPFDRSQRPPIMQDDADGAQRALQMLQFLQERIENDQDCHDLLQSSYQLVMQAFVNRGRVRWIHSIGDTSSSEEDDEGSESSNNLICAADQVEALFQQLQQLIPNNISTDTVDLVLQAYANCATPRGGKSRNYAYKADELWQEAMNMNTNLQHIDDTNRLISRVRSAKHVIHAYAWQQSNRQPGDCASRATQILEENVLLPLENLHFDENKDYAILVAQCYRLIIEAWSKSSDRNSAENAQYYFDKLVKLCKDNNTYNVDEESLRLDPEAYSNLIIAWTKTDSIGGTTKAHNLLFEMVSLYKQGLLHDAISSSTIAFNTVLIAHSKIGDVKKAEDVLQLMEDLATLDANFALDRATYNHMMYAYHTHYNPRQALKSVCAIISKMSQYNDPLLQPDALSYFTLLKCQVSANLVDQAEETMTRIEDIWRSKSDTSIQRNNHVHNIVIHAYSKSNDCHAATKALRILDRMRESKFYKPTIVTLTSVINCLSKSTDKEYALTTAVDLLRHALQEYKDTGDTNVLPNCQTYASVIQLYAKNQGSVMTARALLEQLCEIYNTTENPKLKPNEYVYNNVIHCAANAVHDKDIAFKIATKTYQEMRKSDYLRPDSFTYAFWFKCCSNLLPKGELRYKCISYALDECKRDGLVNGYVISRVCRGCVTTDEALRLFELQGMQNKKREITESDLPTQWTRNV